MGEAQAMKRKRKRVDARRGKAAYQRGYRKGHARGYRKGHEAGRRWEQSGGGIPSTEPTIRRIVEERTLERAFHSALFPTFLFRADVRPTRTMQLRSWLARALFRLAARIRGKA